MEINLELKKSIRRYESSRTGNQISSSKSRERIKAKKVVHGLNSNFKHEIGFGTNDRFSGQPKSYASNRGGCLEDNTSKDDELVKYMSNVPGYLRSKKDENVQEKVLNVGVLDWTRLEKWKRKQRHLQPEVGKRTSSIPTFSNENYARQRQPHCLSSSIDKLSYENCSSRNVKLSSQRPKCLLESEIAPEMTLQELLDIDKKDNVNTEVCSRMETPLSNLRDCGNSHVKEHYGRVCNFGAEETLFDVMKRDDDFFADKTGLSSMFTSCEQKANFAKKVRTRKASKRSMKSIDSEISIDNPDCYSERRNIVLLFPKNSHRHNFIEEDPYMEPTVPSAKGLTSGREYVSGQYEKHVLHCDTKEKMISIELRPETLYSNEIPSKLPEGEPAKQCNTVPKSVQENAYDKGKSNMEPSNSEFGKKLRVLDQQTMEVDKDTRYIPNQQINIPQLSRSLSLQEGPRVPHLSSTYASVKSGPVNSEIFAGFGISNWGRVDDNKRSKSNALRRLLGPLLKSKGTKPPRSTSSVQSKEFFDLDFEAVYSSGSIGDKGDDKSTVQATLHITIENDIPFYKLALNDGINILAASTELFNEQAKDDGRNYTFYSYTDINKTNGIWFTQGKKEKTCGHAYRVLGQMKVTDYSSTGLIRKCPNDHPVMREAVLFSVEQRKADNDLPKLILNQEIAAVVIKDPYEVSINDVKLSEKDSNPLNKSCTKCSTGDSCVCKIRRFEAWKNTTVILPRGIHGMPQKERPSSLINRWKTGGLCDCGGWDVGCELRILSIKNHCKSPTASKDCPFPPSVCFELYNQAETQQDRSVLSLVPIEGGMYTVKFDASISVLQAFFICIAALSVQYISSLSDLAESKVVQGTINKDGNLRCPAITSVQESYVPSPPNSLVGRA